MSKLANMLVIDDLRQMASVPNSLDRNVLRQIENGIAGDVMKIHAGALDKESLSAAMNSEYRRRAGTAQGFSSALYLEAAANHYRLEMRRFLQQARDFVAHGMTVAKQHFATSVNEMSAKDPGVNEIADRVAQNFNDLNGAVARLSSVESHSTSNPVSELQQELRQGMSGLVKDPFAASMLAAVHSRALEQRGTSEDEQAPSAGPGRP